MLDIKSAVRNNIVPIIAAMAGGLYAAFQIGPAWGLIAIPVFIFVLGMERLYAALPPKIKPFAGLISLVAFFVIMMLFINFFAAAWKSPIVQQALTQRSSAPALIPVPGIGEDQLLTQQPLEADPETANRVYGLFVAQLNKRTEADKGFDQVTWMQSMSECLGSNEQQGTLTPEDMEKIAACADQRMKERMQKAQ